MPAEFEERLVHAGTVQRQHLGEDPRHCFLLRTPGRLPPLRATLPGSGSADGVHLPVRGEGNFLKNDDGGRHHIVGQQPANVGPDGVR